MQKKEIKSDFIVKTLAESLNDEQFQNVVLGKIVEGLRERGEWGKYGLYSKLADSVGFSASYISKSLMKKKPLRHNFVEKMAEYLEVSISWLQGESSLSYEQEVKWYTEQYKPGMDRAVAYLGGVNSVQEGLYEEWPEEKIKAYDQEFPQVCEAMAQVPRERQEKVSEYVFVKAHKDGFVKQQPDEAE